MKHRKLTLLALPVLALLFFLGGLLLTASAQTATPTPTASPEPFPIERTLEDLFFGSVWYFGLLIFLVVALVVLKLWKFAGVILIPVFILFEVQYYNRLAATPELSWAMVFLGFMVLGMAVYTVMVAKK